MIVISGWIVMLFVLYVLSLNDRLEKLEPKDEPRPKFLGAHPHNRK